MSEISWKSLQQLIETSEKLKRRQIVLLQVLDLVETVRSLR